MVVLSDRLQNLKKKKELLLEKKALLIEKIKTKYPDFYSWTVDNNIDLNNLKPYFVNISAAFLISMQSLYGSDGISILNKKLDSLGGRNDKYNIEAEVNEISVEELQGLSYEEKADLVWDRYGSIIMDVSERYDLDPRLVFATIMLESGGNTYALRSEPAINDASYGLGQMLYGTAVLMGFEGTPQELYNPEKNLELVGVYHRRNLEVYGENLTPEQLTIAYNAGSPYSYPHPGHIDKFRMWFNITGDIINERGS